MKSPFPGMDPYLENPAYWSDFHARFVTYLCDMIADRLPANYEARIDERVSVAGRSAKKQKLTEPDVSVLQRPGTPTAPREAATAVAQEPVTIPLLMRGPRRQRYIKILQHPERILVTVIELLSPSNKSGDGRGAYLANREALLWQEVHLVEIDLLLRGQRLPMGKPLPAGDYYAFVSRSGRRPNCEVYARTIRQPLPTIPIPLKAPDPDIPIDLTAVFDTAYERGHYADALAYDQPPPVPLSDEQRDWALERAKSVVR